MRQSTIKLISVDYSEGFFVNFLFMITISVTFFLVLFVNHYSTDNFINTLYQYCLENAEQ